MPGQAGAGRGVVIGLLARGGEPGGRGAAGLGEAQPWPGLPGGQPDGVGGPGAAAGGFWRGGGDGHAGDRASSAHARAAAAGGAGQECPQAGLAAGGREPEQHGGGDAGAGGQVAVAGELGGDAAEVLAAGVVLEEEVGSDGPAGGLLGPLAVAVGPGQVTPQGGAAPFGPPAGQGGVPGAPALGGQGAEHRVGPCRVGELGGQGDGEGPVAAVAELAGGDAVLGGQEIRAGFVEDEVQRGGPGRGEGAEPVDGAKLVKGEQPGGGRAAGAEREPGDLGGGQDAVFVQHPQQPPVPGGEPGGERGEQPGAAGQPPARVVRARAARAG